MVIGSKIMKLLDREKFSKTEAYLDLLFSCKDDGVFESSLRGLADRWTWHRNTVTDFLNHLQELGLVSEILDGKIVLTVPESVPLTVPQTVPVDFSKHEPKKEEVSSTCVPQTVPESVPPNVPVEKMALPLVDIYNNNTSVIPVELDHSKIVDHKETTGVIQPTVIPSANNPKDNTSSLEKAAHIAAPEVLQKVKKSSRRKKTPEQKAADKIIRAEKKNAKAAEGEKSPTMAICIHLLCTRRTFNNFGFLNEHVRANIKASRKFRFCTPKQIATACIVAMAEAKDLGFPVVHLETVWKKMAMCDKEITDPKVSDFMNNVLGRYQIEKESLISRNSTLIVPDKNLVQTPQPVA